MQRIYKLTTSHMAGNYKNILIVHYLKVTIYYLLNSILRCKLNLAST